MVLNMTSKLHFGFYRDGLKYDPKMQKLVAGKLHFDVFRDGLKYDPKMQSEPAMLKRYYLPLGFPLATTDISTEDISVINALKIPASGKGVDEPVPR